MDPGTRLVSGTGLVLALIICLVIPPVGIGLLVLAATVVGCAWAVGVMRDPSIEPSDRF